jgi:hypothetical protein
MKNAQAALEFMVTYGWVLIVILVMVGGVVYFGVAKPDRFIADGCSLSDDLKIQKYAIYNTGAQFELRNTFGKDIDIKSIKILEPEQNTIISSLCTIYPDALQNGDSKNYRCEFIPNAFPADNSKKKFNIQVIFNKDGSIVEHTLNGQCVAQPNTMPITPITCGGDYGGDCCLPRSLCGSNHCAIPSALGAISFGKIDCPGVNSCFSGCSGSQCDASACTEEAEAAET